MYLFPYFTYCKVPKFQTNKTVVGGQHKIVVLFEKLLCWFLEKYTVHYTAKEMHTEASGGIAGSIQFVDQTLHQCLFVR